MSTLEEIKTIPFDPRFPNTNQTRHCYQSYVDYYRCQRIRGSNFAPCDFFKKAFLASCPNSWVEKWDGQREEDFLLINNLMDLFLNVAE
ncbi:hypothetical protein GWI33_016282 [Rhynchophorus ferrugineus]|uniref:Cytochrome c oxidase subunit 6B1 n=1 Tax=Rhynchophorus ferrugineus TaxID=354439 RepID=A0A834IBG5_RHYFE|nr:hypothetical protein GWI33_016282 [Rhynchophorus ferrugineus]